MKETEVDFERFTFERFTDKAIKGIMLAEEEARRVGHNLVGTEQILLGLIREGTGVAAKVLKSMGVNLKKSRVEVVKIIGAGAGFVPIEIPFSPRAKVVLELSFEEARQLGHNYIGTEHLLLSLIREGDGVGARVLEDLVIDLTKVRTQVFRKIGEQSAFAAEQKETVDVPIDSQDIRTKVQSDTSILKTSEEKDLVSKLERLASLKERGLLTNKEFVAAKGKLLFN